MPNKHLNRCSFWLFCMQTLGGYNFIRQRFDFIDQLSQFDAFLDWIPCRVIHSPVLIVMAIICGNWFIIWDIISLHERPSVAEFNCTILKNRSFPIFASDDSCPTCRIETCWSGKFVRHCFPISETTAVLTLSHYIQGVRQSVERRA